MTELSQADLVDQLVAAFASQKPIRAGSFIITIYGDAVAPRGGAASMQGLLTVMDTVGVSDSLVRTAVSRLVSDRWLARTRVGRRSFYRLTDSGRRRFEEATRRIYAGPPTPIGTATGAWFWSPVAPASGGSGCARNYAGSALASCRRAR